MQTRELTATARHRLDSLSPSPSDGDVSTPDLPDEAPPAPVPAAAPETWVSRWVPEQWRGARVDPGRRGAVALAAVAAGAAVVAAVGVWRDQPVARDPVPPPALVVASATPAPPTEVQPPTMVVVSVGGAVAEPGLVTLPTGSRVADAVAAAGGAKPGTDLLTLNLAQPLSDGEQVLVGVPGPPVSGGAAVDAGPAEGAAPGTAAAIDLNAASAAELEELPGVGPVMAQAIIDYRTEHQRFSSVDQLTDVAGIGDVRFARLKDLVRV